MENSLDAAESISQLPDIDVTMCASLLSRAPLCNLPAMSPPCTVSHIAGTTSQSCCSTPSQLLAIRCPFVSLLVTKTGGWALVREEVSQRRLNDIRGVENHERLDEELYQDFEPRGRPQGALLTHLRRDENDRLFVFARLPQLNAHRSCSQ